MGVIRYAGELHSSSIEDIDKVIKALGPSSVLVEYQISSKVVTIKHSDTGLTWVFSAALVRDLPNQFVAVNPQAEAVYIIKEGYL